MFFNMGQKFTVLKKFESREPGDILIITDYLKEDKEYVVSINDIPFFLLQKKK